MGNFKNGAHEYHLIKGCNGLYQIIVLPLYFVGLHSVFRLFQEDKKRVVPLLFLSVYLLMNVEMVVAMTLEHRHLAQFLPSFIIVAALPDTREKKTAKELRTVAVDWFAAVIIVHLAWAITVKGS